MEEGGQNSSMGGQKQRDILAISMAVSLWKWLFLWLFPFGSVANR